MIVKLVAAVLFVTLRVTAEESAGAVAYVKEDFDARITEGPHFVKFYAPWCGHCKRLAPTWDALADSFKPETVVIAKVDCTTETALCSAHSVTGYPTLKFFDGNADESTTYKGARDLETLEKWINEKLGIATPAPAAVEEELTKDNNVFVLTQNSYEKHVSEGGHFVKFYAPWCPHCKNMVGTWDDLAAVYNTEESKVSIAKVDCTAHREVCTANDVKGYPTLLWIYSGEKVEKYSGGRDLDSLKAFVERMKNEKKFMGTNEDKIPKQEQGQDKDAQDEGVLVLDGSNFAETIAKGVAFVEFYAPWCGHCKRLAPTWVELGKKFQESSNVHIAKVDCTENRELCGSNEVRGFPTLILFKNGEKVEVYNGKRDLEELSSYVEGMVPHDEL